MDIVSRVKNAIKRDCLELGHFEPWFYPVHLLAVEKNAKYLLKKMPDADSLVILLAVWCHDLQRIHGLPGDHQKAGAEETKRFLPQFGVSKEIIKKVADIVALHDFDARAPKSLEAKILVCADAMSHFDNSFYVWLISSWLQRKKFSMKQAKKDLVEKIELDFNKRIFFEFAKKKLEKKYKLFKEFYKTV
ncbi:MAG: hypothetical protein UT32_C0004G0018 [Parcubacteria group bacterium GW2011_GWC2_39_14]|nr:MAG: hypothetical protein UT32_C0004G0018 [Parcubacteria group bacterium GW2011_GWC2_39_14]KKR54862.1 MAG: hypothetical protein UT91_C0008G0018 [Parcubacteria group bacterium GW2011_GWA2_40_23]